MITTEQEALKAVSKDGLALQAVPEQLMTEEMCLEAVKRAPESLRWVPKCFRTAALKGE
ncbi:MAG: hypothetical protein K6E40_10355 [Desulfovibrio sp.]|nr:hypothetical protein [Desulfovibrio sp.]